MNDGIGLYKPPAFGLASRTGFSKPRRFPDFEPIVCL
jgi:hypothetical protein